MDQNMDWTTMNNFDILDDDHDQADFTTKELNRYFLEGHIDPMMNGEDDNDEEEEEDEPMIEGDHQFSDQNEGELSEKQHEMLSQKLSQLSTKADNDNDSDKELDQDLLVINNKRRLSTTSTSDVIPKKMKMTTDDDDNEDGLNNDKHKIPTYLLLTHETFNYFVQNLIRTTNSITMHDIQYIAICIHHIAAIHIQKQITIIYFKSGTGTLRDPQPELEPVDRRVWPEQVKSAISHATNTTIMETDLDQAQIAYENLVHQRLQEMNKQTDQYETDLDDKKNQLIDFTSTMERLIRKYVQQHGIQPLKLQRDLKIALLKHDYDAEIIERKFLQEKPNDYQIQTAHRLYEARNELEKTKRELLELKQRVIYNKPPLSYNSIEKSIEDNNHQQQQTLIRQKKLDLMAQHILKLERKLDGCQKTFDDQLSKMWQNHRNLVENKGMSTTCSNLIEERFINITDRWRAMYIYRLFYHIQGPYGDLEILEKKKIQNSNNSSHEEQQSIKRIGFQPQMIIHTKHSFDDQQLRLLNRGPTYVPPCQIHVLFSNSTAMDDILKKQYAPLKHQLAYLFNKYKISVALQFTIQHDVFDEFQKAFSMPLPPDIYKRAHDEQTLIQRIRQSLKNNNLILRRTADNMNTFYLGKNQDFESKAEDYLTKTDQYKLFFTINQNTDEQAFRLEMNKLIDSVNHGLTILRRRNDIDESLYHRLRTDAAKVKLPHLYFLPNVSQENNVTLLPIITSKHSVTYKISKYLDQLLRPFANEKMKSVIFNDGIEFIQKLHTYVHTEQRLTPTTMFCTIEITNYSTLDSHDTLIDVVCNFIRNNVAANKLYKIPIMTIKNLLQLCLYNNIFSYKNKFYTFNKGGPTTLPLTDTLSNIYLFAWQKKIIDEIEQNKELFGRYKNQLFFTWNGFKNELEYVLETIRQRSPHLHLRIHIDTSVSYLNAYIANQNGRLYTRVYHDSTIQPYLLPYVVGHSKINHSDWIRTALLRAVCYCSSIDDFNQERIYIELTCLVNGYSLRFVNSRILHFYDYFHTGALRYSTDQLQYSKFRRQWFDFTDMQREYSNKLQNLDDNGHFIRLHYLYEFGARCQFNEEFLKLWTKHFATNPILCKEKTAISLSTKHIYSLNALLAQQKSFCWTST